MKAFQAAFGALVLAMTGVFIIQFVARTNLADAVIRDYLDWFAVTYLSCWLLALRSWARETP